MKLTRLEATDFETLAKKKTEMGPDAKLMARGFLVDARTLTEVAAEHNVTKQRVHSAVETLRKEYEKSGMNGGWFELELELPHPLAIDIERFASALSSQSDPARRQAALVKIARAIASAEHALQD